jgi:hypothetical protein
MIIIGIVLAFVGLAYLCWLLFALAVYALPLFTAVAVGLAAYCSGSGPIGAMILAAAAGSVTLLVGRLAFARFRSPLIRASIAFVFVLPAAVAGFHAALGLAHVMVPAEGWHRLIAVAGGILVSAIAWTRVAFFARPDARREAAADTTQSLTSLAKLR